MRTNHLEGKSLFALGDGHVDQMVRITFEGEEIAVPAGISVAAALLANGVRKFRSTPVTGSSRAPFCMMGVCFECLVEINGRPSRQACMAMVTDGMVIRRQNGASALDVDGGEN